MPAELVAFGERVGEAPGHRLDPGGVDPLGLRVQAPNEAGGLARPDDLGELGPIRIAPIHEADDRAQIAGAPPAQNAPAAGVFR